MFSAAIKSGSAGTPKDPQFNYVTMLLHGDGTNGAQNNTFVDSSTNNFTITRNGNTTQGTFTPYGANWSNYFDGTGDYLSLPANTALNVGTGDFTWETWAYLPNNTSDYSLFSGVTNGDIDIRRLTDGTLRIGRVNTAWDSTSSVISIANTWAHLAISRSGSTLKIYANGAQIFSGTNSNNYSIASSAQIGRTGTVDGLLLGYLSNTRLVKGTAVYTSAFTPSTTPLTAITNTSLLTCQSNRFIDNSTNNFTITKNGDVSVQRFSPFSPTTAYSTSVIGGSGYFDGSGDYLSIANQTALHLGGGDFSIECWTYLTSTSGAQRPISQNDSNYEFAFYIANGGGITAYSFQSSGTQNFGISGGTLVTGQWYHLACTRTGSTVAFFVNGVRQGTATFSGTVDSQTAGWDIGAIGAGTDPQKGYITDARLVFGSNPYGVGTTLTLPTSPLSAITGTSLLLNFTNAGILDNAMMNDLETVGNAQISTSVKKYGTGSMYFDGTGDYLVPSAPSSNVTLGLGSGDFTVEFWVYFIGGLGSDIVLFDGRPLSTNGAYPTIYVNSSSQVSYVVSSADRITSASAFSTSTWYHIAVARSGTSTKMFVNGTQVGSTYTDSTNYLSASRRPTIAINGFNETAAPLNGYIDDLRITKGVARYVVNFTPPTAAFPNN
jgi:hypothetical protein